ncbi:MAG: tryptophan-rich sensory protein [Deltaproteobacteria bacterium]|nr:tryptophan-rich sensory protein [Nannocystaceae bacterium]
MTATTAIAGGLATRSSVRGWYRRLDKPEFTPPDVVFPVAWTVLYSAMTVSAWRTWKAPRTPRRKLALGLWGLQLALNAAWSPLFFGLRRPGVAMFDIVALAGAIAGYVVVARKVNRPAAGLMLPYLGWVGFASALNASIWLRNR